MWADNSGAVLDWVMDMTDPEGIQTRDVPVAAARRVRSEDGILPGVPRRPLADGRYQQTLDHSLSLKNLEKHALKSGVEIRYQTRAMQLIRQGKRQSYRCYCPR